MCGEVLEHAPVRFPAVEVWFWLADHDRITVGVLQHDLLGTGSADYHAAVTVTGEHNAHAACL
jgi:hypothetical protein